MTETAVRKRYPKPPDFRPEPVFGPNHRWAGRPRCQAWNPNAGRQCGALQSKRQGVDKCRKHGAQSPRGRESPNFRHGKYVVPDALSESYLRQRSDPALLELREEIALLDARLLQVTADLDSSEAESTWEVVKDKVNELFALHADPTKYTKYKSDQLVFELNTIVNEGIDYYFRWREIIGYLDARRRLVETERKRHKDLYEFLTVEHLLGLVGQIVDIVRPELPNDNARKRVGDKIRHLIS